MNYTRTYHKENISSKSFLITGGSGFIGSNIAEYLLQHKAGKVRILDNLSTGSRKNIEPFFSNQAFEFMEGDITDYNTCLKACEGIHYVSHQAALGSVPRSLKNPLATHAANVTGFLNMLQAAKERNVEKFVYASSSSVYGDSQQLPKTEPHTGRALSPYAVSKMADELYAGVYALNYGIKIIGLRYFNIYGMRQNPSGPYAAVIPLFMDAILHHKTPVIFGDGEQTRDFTFIENAVQANILAFCNAGENAWGRVYNIACGNNISVNKLFNTLNRIAGTNLKAEFKPERAGDVRNSLADISLARTFLGYQPSVSIEEGLSLTFDWFRKNCF